MFHQGNLVNQLKASYFDSQAHAEWAAPDYTPVSFINQMVAAQMQRWGGTDG